MCILGAVLDPAFTSSFSPFAPVSCTVFALLVLVPVKPGAGGEDAAQGPVAALASLPTAQACGLPRARFNLRPWVLSAGKHPSDGNPWIVL